MTTKQTLMLAGWLAVASLIAGCASAPETGRKQLLLVDSAQEAQMGYKAFEQIKRETPISRDRGEWQRLKKVGDRIAESVQLPQARWEFVLFEDKQPNAFALPGGKVGVYTGILPITKDDAGLAAVIGHEIAHVSARHGAERTSQGMLVQVGGTALSALLGDQSGLTRALAMQAYQTGAEVGVLLPYSRTQELEADRIGLMYMARAGYDPREAIAFWKRFQAYNAKSGGTQVEFMSTHPLDDTRIAALEQSLPKAIAEYERARNRP